MKSKRKEKMKKQKINNKRYNSRYTYEQNLSIRHKVTNKSKVTKTHTRTTATSYQESRTCETYGTLKHVLRALNIQVSLDNSLHTNNEYNKINIIQQLQIHRYTCMNE